MPKTVPELKTEAEDCSRAEDCFSVLFFFDETMKNITDNL